MTHAGIRMGASLALLAALGVAKAATPAGGPGTLYAKNCQSCHAVDGKGNPKMVKALKVTPADLDLLDGASLKKNDADLARIIAEGANKKMLAYGKKLVPAQINDLIAFIRGMVKPATR